MAPLGQSQIPNVAQNNEREAHLTNKVYILKVNSIQMQQTLLPGNTDTNKTKP
jgi:hypothetical protein